MSAQQSEILYEKREAYFSQCELTCRFEVHFSVLHFISCELKSGGFVALYLEVN